MEDRRGEGLSARTLELTSGDARARIALAGAEAIAWSAGGRDLLWTPSGAHWDCVAPILFPCVGWSRDGVIIVDGRDYRMPVHGFASGSYFELVEASTDRAVLELTASAATRAHYPFGFRLRATYALSPRALRIELQAANAGDEPLPYACGLHPGFNWPLAAGSQEDCRIVFQREEAPEVPLIAPGGLFSARTRPVPLDGRVLPLSPALFAAEALCFLNARSRSLMFEGPGVAIEALAEGFRHWALWSRPGAPFLCLEAWTGHGDPEGFRGDFRTKPSIDMLAPGEARSHALTLRFSQT